MLYTVYMCPSPLCKMAAPRNTSLDSDSDSSDEDLERFREAAWEPPGIKSSQSKQQDAVAPAVPSFRVQADCHEHDGNELQTTPEFRSHVAKKLTAILDRCIKEIPTNSVPQNKSATVLDEDDAYKKTIIRCGGFRLFCTSVPGDIGKEAPVTNSRRKVVLSSSEDSEEEERRCREAAVSGSDILRNSALPQVHLITMDSTDLSEPHTKKKKKKKQRRDELEEGEEHNVGITQPKCNGQESMKKKKEKLHEEHKEQKIEESNGQSLKKKKKRQKVDM